MSSKRNQQELVKAKILSALPQKPSERPFAEKLQLLDFPVRHKPYIWFVKLPGLKDVDAVIWIPSTGLFIVEMKSWPLSGIRRISTPFELEPWVKHSTKKSPWDQVQEAEQQFRNRLVNDTKTYAALGYPWPTPVAALYNISRSDFEERATGEIGSQSEKQFKHLLRDSTVFQEDLQSGEELINRLRYCRYNQIYGQSAKDGPKGVNGSEAVKAFHSFVDPHLVIGRPISAYDRDRVKQLEKDSERRLDTVIWDQAILCTGYVGTGKTILGLHAALRRLEALAGSDRSQLPLSTTQDEIAGLFVCFNKVLAADIRRLTALSPRFRALNFDIYDIFGLIKFFVRELELLSSEGGGIADLWAKNTVSRILALSDEKTKKLLDSWSIVVVDEAQDLQDWAWDFLERLSDSGRRLFVIDGKKQLLYRNKRSVYLDILNDIVKEQSKGTNYIEQRRVYRTTDTTFLICQLFVEKYPNLESAQDFWDKTLRPAYEKAKKKIAEKDPLHQPALPGYDLPRRGGFAPHLIPLKSQPQADIIIRVTDILKKGYEATKQYYLEEEPSNVLLLVPFKEQPTHKSPYRYDWAHIARSACQNLSLRFIDYSDENQRRRAYAGDEVRICTFHSSRGVEGLHSIVLGFDLLAEAAGVEWKIENLGYVVLSRSVYDTDVVYIEDNLAERSEIKFLKGIVEITGK
jgi:hypothetical protein